MARGGSFDPGRRRRRKEGQHAFLLQWGNCGFSSLYLFKDHPELEFFATDRPTMGSLGPILSFISLGERKRSETLFPGILELLVQSEEDFDPTSSLTWRGRSMCLEGVGAELVGAEGGGL